MIRRITLQTTYGPIETEAQIVAPGLALHNESGRLTPAGKYWRRYWRLTQVRSGLFVAGATSRAVALRVAASVGPLADWRRPRTKLPSGFAAAVYNAGGTMWQPNP